MQIYTAEIEDLPSDTPCYCDGCDWTGPFKDIEEVERCSLTPGDSSPAGRCPLCEALAYVSGPGLQAAAEAPPLRAAAAQMIGLPSMAVEHLRAALVELGWSNRHLAGLLECDERTVRRWVLGTLAIPGPVSSWLTDLIAAHRSLPPPRDWRTAKARGGSR